MKCLRPKRSASTPENATRAAVTSPETLYRTPISPGSRPARLRNSGRTTCKYPTGTELSTRLVSRSRTSREPRRADPKGVAASRANATVPPLPLLVLVPPPLLLQALPPLRPPVPSVLALPQPPLVLVALLLTTVAAPLDATVVATLARLEVPRAGLPTVARMLVPPQPLKLALPQQSLARLLARPLTPVFVALQLATVEAR